MINRDAGPCTVARCVGEHSTDLLLVFCIHSPPLECRLIYAVTTIHVHIIIRNRLLFIIMHYHFAHLSACLARVYHKDPSKS